MSALVTVEGLTIVSPGGVRLLDGVDFELQPGEIVCLLGGSGAGKSTFMNALSERASLERAGFAVQAKTIETATPIGVVPQRGALFDHLDVAGNLALAMRNAESGPKASTDRVAQALESVELPPGWADSRHAVGDVSGGEAQRLAVARTLAGGRKILFLDEPSVGLDPLRVDGLADLLRAEIKERGAGAIVVTHDLDFATGFADRFIYMGRSADGLEPIELEALREAGPREAVVRAADVRSAASRELGRLIRKRLSHEDPPRASGGRSMWARAGEALLERLRTASASFANLPKVLAGAFGSLRHPRDFLEVFSLTLKQALLRPAGFFAIVSTLLGLTMLYIFHRALGGGEIPVRADRVFSLVGSMHIIALAPPLCGILFSATSGNAVTAWLGGMSLTKQTQALRGLGISESRYLWLPAFLGLALSFAILAAVFLAGMVFGGVAYLSYAAPELGDPMAIVTADLIDPPPDREVFLLRGKWLIATYALGIAADAIAKGSRDKRSAESVTIAMVRSVMSCTLWIVAIELLSLVWIYA